MSTSANSLPDYETPPVVEVVFAVATASLPMTLVDLARFGLENLEEFPERQEQPPMAMPTESLQSEGQTIGPSLALLSGVPPGRLWFQSSDHTRLVQLQKDWLACNWQGASTDKPYPHYESIEGLFLETWDKWSKFVNDQGFGEVVAAQCELSYINHVAPGTVWQSHGEVDKVVRLAGRAEGFLPQPEDGQVMFRYRMSDGEKDVGRLYVQATPGLRPADRSPVIQLNLTARGFPSSNDRVGLTNFFRLAHRWIVEGFASATTDVAQDQLWGRIR